MKSIKELDRICEVLRLMNNKEPVYFFFNTTHEFNEATSWMKMLGSEGVSSENLSQHEDISSVFSYSLNYSHHIFYYIDLERSEMA